MSKPTPGPWEVCGPHLNDPSVTILGAERDDGWSPVLATMRKPDSRLPEEEVMANAKIMAIGPELLEALQKMLEGFGIIKGGPDYKFAQDAILKATGKPYEPR